MSYYSHLNLSREPFSTSPDPDLLFLSREHKSALYRLCVAVKLRRGQSLILGDVGTGKTTLSRKFCQMMACDAGMIVRVILNPGFEGAADFLRAICEQFGVATVMDGQPAGFAEMSAAIRHYLFQKGVEEKKTVVLVVDEAQKMNEASLEVLRGLLNYETNDHKLLQAVMFSQLDLVPRLLKVKNFWDRISMKALLRTLSFEEARQMIAFRMQVSGAGPENGLFSDEALQSIYQVTRGYPRRITQLCHDCLESLVMNGRSRVDRQTVDEILEREVLIGGRLLGSLARNESRPGTATNGTHVFERSHTGRAAV
ncbi:MAG: AAA family ATPase [Candidatus Omnitrophica bacterium]|nr:AAA family ATPase [Candidatus Omnitrophota bacterium]